MANILDLMDLKQILTLHIDGISNRKISEIIGIHRNTINAYVQLFNASKYSKKELLELEDFEFCKLFPAHTTIKNPRFNELMLFFKNMHEDKKHAGFTFLHHYAEYKEKVKEPYSYTQFMAHYHRKYPKGKGSMKLNHKPGNELYIDFTGKKLQFVDRQSGEITHVEVFVTILPSSQYTYVEACLNQTIESLITCTANALAYYGGVPKAIVSDNLKSAVTKYHKHEPTINRSFMDFARHYNCVVNPTRSYSPQDKALVEHAVNLVYQRIYYPMRNMTFFSLRDINEEIWRLLETYNNLLQQRRPGSRREIFQSTERDQLKPLPTESYEIKNYRRAKVQKTGYIYFSPDKSYYSVPYRYIGKSTQIQYSQSTVEVYYNHLRIASHQRNPALGEYNTDTNHLCSTHQAYLEWSPDYFKQKALKHGLYVHDFVASLFNDNDYPEIAYKRAMGIIQLHRDYGSERLNKACKLALEVGIHSYKRIKNILKNKRDIYAESLETENQNHIPFHNNIRGASNYK